MAKDWYNNIRMGHKWYTSTLECRLVEMCASEGTLQTPWRLLPALTFIEEDDADDHQSILRQLEIKYANMVVYGLNAFGPFVCFCSCYLKFKLWMQWEWIGFWAAASLFKNKTIIGDETFARVTVSRHFTKLFDILRAGCQRLKVVVSRFHQSEEERSLAWEGEAEYKESGPAFILHSSLRGQPRHHIFIWSHHCWHNSHICTHEQSPLSLFPSSCLSLCRWAIEATFQNLNIMLAKI